MTRADFLSRLKKGLVGLPTSTAAEILNDYEAHFEDGVAAGRTEARELLDTAVDFLFSNRPAGIVRIENVPAALDTRDRETGAYLASITVPVTVRPPV